MTTTNDLVRFVQSAFARLGDPKKAVEMAAYMKTTTPFYGVQKPDREPVYKEMKTRFLPTSRAEYEERVQALWGLPHREEKYTAVTLARQAKRFITREFLPLYERLIREGAWWDLVDEIAAHLVGAALKADRGAVGPVLERWIDDDDLWIRRAALLAQIRHGADADEEMLFSFVRKRAHEKDFFMRKAVGWALREHARKAPERVRAFLEAEGASLSPLSYREGARGLVKLGLMESDKKPRAGRGA